MLLLLLWNAAGLLVVMRRGPEVLRAFVRA
jgi:hypothetical protein